MGSTSSRDTVYDSNRTWDCRTSYMSKPSVAWPRILASSFSTLLFEMAPELRIVVVELRMVVVELRMELKMELRVVVLKLRMVAV